MAFRRINNKESDSGFQKFYDEFSKLSEKDREYILNKIDGNTDRMVDPVKLKKFLIGISLFRDFFNDNCESYKLDVNQKNGIIKIILDEFNISDVPCFKDLFRNARSVEILPRVDHRMEVSVEYELTRELGGR